MSKSADAFRTISEVAQELDLPQHVLRFWETRFSQIKPMKRGGGRRYYRPDDVELLRGIKHLLYGEGYTIKGVQRILKEQGIRHVIMSVHGQEGETENSDSVIPAHMDAALHSTEPSQLEVARPPLVMPPVTSQTIETNNPATHNVAPAPSMAEPLQPRPPQPSAQIGQAAVPPVHPYENAHSSSVEHGQVGTPAAVGQTQLENPAPPPEAVTYEAAPMPIAPLEAQGSAEASVHHTPMMQQSAASHQMPTSAPAQSVPPVHHGHSAAPVESHVVSESNPSTGIFSRFKNEKPAQELKETSGPSHIAKDDVRRLQSTLFELLECKRILDRANS